MTDSSMNPAMTGTSTIGLQVWTDK